MSFQVGRNGSHAAVAGCALLWTAAALPACSAPERDDRIDYMVFQDDDGVDDGAVISVRPPRRPPAARTPLLGLPPLRAVPAANCANASERSGTSQSQGSTTAGSLTNGCQMPRSGPGWLAVNDNAFGTDETVALLQYALAATAAQFPRTPPVVVGGLSKPEGGLFRPHKSHQSGRDVDIGYAHTSAQKRFLDAEPANLDLERTWFLLSLLLGTGKVSFVFMDYQVQAQLYEALLDQGWKEAQLEPLFQYPAGATVGQGIIRHAAGHLNHFHVRFRCPDGDRPGCLD